MPVFRDDLGRSDTQLVPAPEIEVQDGQSMPSQELRVRLPQSADTYPPLDKLVQRLGLAGQLAKINAVNGRYTREEAIPLVKQCIQLDANKLKEAKDDKAMREAVQRLEESVQVLKELLSGGRPK